MSRYRAIKDPTKYIIFGTGLIILGIVIILGYLWVFLHPPLNFDVVTATTVVLIFGFFWVISGIILIIKRNTLL